MFHSANVRSWRPREELALSLTPVVQDELTCTDYPMGALCREETLSMQLLDLHMVAQRATSYTELMSIFKEMDEVLALIEREMYKAEIDSPDVAWKTHEEMRAKAIDDESKTLWRRREAIRRLIKSMKATQLAFQVAIETGVITIDDTDPLDARLAEMTWLRTPPNSRRKAKGRRYTAPGDHGTAPARRQIAANRRERLRKARANRRNKHYTPAHKLRAIREDHATWTAEADDEFGYDKTYRVDDGC